jgi:hypothetical protein
VILVSIAWVSALFYLAARLGVDTQVRLSFIDAAHVYVGLVAAVIILAKVARVGFHEQVPGVANVQRWQRWISWSMLVSYAAIFASGVLLLFPLHGILYNDLVNFHLMSSVWAVPPTTWHVWHYRQRAAPYLVRLLPRAGTARYWAGVALVLLPAVALLAFPRAVSQLPQVFGGAAWTGSALPGSYLDHIQLGSTPGSLIAVGDALYVSPDGSIWYQVDLPAGTTQGPAVHVHTGTAPKGPVALSLAESGSSVFVGTADGLFRTDNQQGPLVDAGLPGKEVAAIAVDPGNPRLMVAGSSAGPMRSTDGGLTWNQLGGTGLTKPAAIAALAFVDEQLYASDSTGVFEWSPAAAIWQRISSEPSVVDLTGGAGGQLYATSTSQGVTLHRDGQWFPTASLASPHQHHLAGNEVHPQVFGLTPYDGRLYAIGTAYGVSASSDGGQTWTQLGGGLENATAYEAIVYDGSLLAATSDGVYRFRLQEDPAPSVTWWALVLLAAAACGLMAIALVGTGRRPRLQAPGAEAAPGRRAPEEVVG